MKIIQASETSTRRHLTSTFLPCMASMNLSAMACARWMGVECLPLIALLNLEWLFSHLPCLFS